MSAPSTPNLSNVSADDFWKDLGIKPQEAEQATDYDGWTVTDIGVNPLIWLALTRDLLAAGMDDQQRAKYVVAARNNHWSWIPWVAASNQGKLTCSWHREPTSNRWGVDMSASYIDISNLATELRSAITSPVEGWHVAEVDWSCCHYQIIAKESGDANMVADLADPSHPLRQPESKHDWLKALNGSRKNPDVRAQLDALFAARWKAGGAWLDDERVKLPDELPDREKTSRALLPLEASYLDDACRLIHDAGMASNLLFPHRDAVVIHGPPEDLPALAERVAGIMRSLLPMAKIVGIGPNWGFVQPNDPTRHGFPDLYPQQLVGAQLDNRANADIARLQSFLQHADSKCVVDPIRYILPMSCYPGEVVISVDGRSKLGNAHKQLFQQQQAATEWEAKQKSGGKPAIEHLSEYPLTDAGTAALLESVHGKHLLPVTNSKDEWYTYQEDQGIWTKVHSGIGVTPRLTKVAGLALDSLCFSPDRDFKQKAESYYKSIGDDGKCSRVASFAWKVASSEHGRPVVAPDFDRNPSVISCRNGTVDLRTGVLRPSTAEDRHTIRIEVDYNPEAKCPNWELLINRVMNHDAEQVIALTNMLGYLITGETREQRLFIWHGPAAANGKGTILGRLSDIFGRYIAITPPSVLADESKGRATEPELADSWSARMLYVSEWPDHSRLSEAKVKAITGGDKQTGRTLFQGVPTTAKPMYTPVITCQVLPTYNVSDAGLARRIVVVPFAVKMRELYPDLDLDKKLIAEHEGILKWLVDAAMAYYSDGLQLAPAWIALTEALRREEDYFSDFLAENYELVPGAKTSSAQIMQTYRSAMVEDFTIPALSPRALGLRLQAANLQPCRLTDGGRGYVGLRPKVRHSHPLGSDVAPDHKGSEAPNIEDLPN